MSDEFVADGFLLAMAAMSMMGRRARMKSDPAYAAKEEERIAEKAAAKLETDYIQACRDDAEYERNPRAFLRRLFKLNEYSENRE